MSPRAGPVLVLRVPVALSHGLGTARGKPGLHTSSAVDLSEGPLVNYSVVDREVWSPGHRADIWITWGAVSLHLPPPPAPAPPPQLNMSLAAMGTCCPAVRGWQGVSWPSLVLRWGKELRTWEIEKYLLFWRYFRSALLGMIFYKWLTKDFLQSYSVADKLLCLYL